MSSPPYERRKSKSRAREGRYKMLRKMFLLEFVEAIVAALIVAAILRLFVISVYRIPTESMSPTLNPGDFVLASKTAYGVQLPFSFERIGAKDPERGDVVIFHLPGDEALFVKRVVGIAGDRIEIKNSQVVVNDVVVTSEFTPDGEFEVAGESSDGSTHRVMRHKVADEPDFLAPLVVPPGQMFLLGDLRSDSVDSRRWGPLPTSFAFAKAKLVIFSVPFSSGRLMKSIE